MGGALGEAFGFCGLRDRRGFGGRAWEKVVDWGLGLFVVEVLRWEVEVEFCFVFLAEDVGVVVLVVIVIVFKFESIQWVQGVVDDTLPDGALQVGEMADRQGVCLCDYWNHDSFLPERTENLDLDIIVKTVFLSSQNTVAGLGESGDVGIELERVQNKEDAVYVGVSKTRATHHLLFLCKCLFELGFDEAGHLSELQVDNVLFQASRVPEREADSLAIHLGLEV